MNAAWAGQWDMMSVNLMKGYDMGLNYIIQVIK